MILKNLIRKSDFGLILDWEFHSKRRWVSTFPVFLVNELISRYNPIIISSQGDYNLNKRKIKFYFSFEGGWASPQIKFDHRIVCKKAFLTSDPHLHTEFKQSYFIQSKVDYILTFYYRPFLKYFKLVPKEKVIHFPWAVPDQFVQQEEIRTRRNGEVSIFGGSSSEAYDFRNWCRDQDGIVSYGNSGVENKVFSDQDYYSWLQKLDAAVAAGSFSSKYQMVTPKYFEILASGCLLIGQYCSDYKHLNIGPTNSLHFSTKEEFLKCVKNYKENPEDYIDIRNEGRRLIQSHHTISKRMEIIDELYKKSL